MYQATQDQSSGAKTSSKKDDKTNAGDDVTDVDFEEVQEDKDKLKNRDHHYGFINYTTALKSNLVMFNSLFHKTSFLEKPLF